MKGGENVNAINLLGQPSIGNESSLANNKKNFTEKNAPFFELISNAINLAHVKTRKEMPNVGKSPDDLYFNEPIESESLQMAELAQLLIQQQLTEDSSEHENKPITIAKQEHLLAENSETQHTAIQEDTEMDAQNEAKITKLQNEASEVIEASNEAKIAELINILYNEAASNDEITAIHVREIAQEAANITRLSNIPNQDLHMQDMNVSLHAHSSLSNAAIHDKKDEQMIQLLTQIETVLNGLTEKEDVRRTSSNLLKLLEKWSELTKEGTGERGTSFLNDVKTRAQGIWKDLVNFYQNRNQLGGNHPYSNVASITTKDIAKWLHKAVFSQSSSEVPVETQQATLTSMPMSRIEQHVIYLNHNQPAYSVDKQLIDQFQQAMSTSRFLSMNNGLNQLSFTLRPDNLGEMMVRLTEIQGEMTVKIIVSSQTTRKMLESNMHQLKHMFSPQQVVIEERVLTVQDLKGNDEEQTFNGDPEEQSEQSNENREQSDEESSFEAHFQELLLNEEVQAANDKN